MIIDGLRTHARDDGLVEQSARLRWSDGEFRLQVAVPPEFAREAPDASPFVCAALLLAMRKAEDLDVRGPVSAPLIANAERIVDLYASWDSRLYRTRFRADDVPDTVPGGGIGSFFSRGVDSMYSAAVPRALPGAVTHLVFCDRLEPKHGPRTRAREIELAREAADLLDTPLVVIESNVRELTDGIVGDWEDMVGAGLALLATSMAGGLSRMIVPSSDGPAGAGPCGTSPLLDPLFSTADVQIEHDALHVRTDKVAWLARERPELVPLIKVCFEEDRPDNCGRCGKCLVTMLALEAAGVLERASGFPDAVDLDALAEQKPTYANELAEYEALRRTLRERGGSNDLVAAVEATLVRGAARDPGRLRITDRTPDFRKRASRHARLMMGHGPGPRSDAPTRQPLRRAPAPPRTTVMMPAFEAGLTLRAAVQSVLAQTMPDLELIVVDDGSDEPLADALSDLRDPRLRIIRHRRNRGLARARNTALAAARAPLVSQLDADDAWEPDYLATVLPRFEDRGVGLVYTNATILGHPTGHDDYIGDPSVHPMHEFPKIAEQSPIPCPTASMRTAAVREVGGYAWWLRQCEDYHLYMKLARRGWRFDYVHRRLARYRWPEAGRSLSSDPRRHELWELAMFGSMVARHPLTPGPRRQVRVRVRREVQHVRTIAAAARVPERRSSGPRVLVAPGSDAVLNLGDIAMLRLCVERLRELIPGAHIEVLTADPERLERHCPGVAPIRAEGFYQWFESRWSGGLYSSLVSPSARDRVRAAAERAARVGPRTARAGLRAELLAREPATDEMRAFVGSLLAADAVVVSGRGGTTDAFRDDGLRLLALLGHAADLGAATAMLGQGLGPLTDPALTARAAAILPRLDLIAVREPAASRAVLAEAGVPDDRVTVTGDDALEPAYARRAAATAPGGIGVGVRVAGYSGLDKTRLEPLRRALGAAAERHGTDLLGIPISLYPHESDAAVLETLVGDDASEVETAEQAMDRAGASRVVVTASYHAAVFALAQGVPVVGVSSSPYYDRKLAGLAELFPGGCAVVAPSESGFEERLAAEIDRAWEDAPNLRPRLLASAERQIASGRSAYARFASMLDGVPPMVVEFSSNGSSGGFGTPRSTPSLTAGS